MDSNWLYLRAKDSSYKKWIAVQIPLFGTSPLSLYQSKEKGHSFLISYKLYEFNYLKNIDFGQKCNHRSVNENFAVNNRREKCQRVHKYVGVILEPQVRGGLYAKNDGMYAVEKRQPFASIWSLASDIVETEHHVLDEELDLENEKGLLVFFFQKKAAIFFP